METQKQPVPSVSTNGDGRTLFLTFGPDQTRQYPVELNQIQFLYRPLWDCSRQVVLTYLCQPVVKSAEEPDPALSLCMAPGNEEDQALLDLLVFRAAISHVKMLHRHGFRLLIACPVHFNSVAVSRHWLELSPMLNAAAPEVIRDIAFLVMGIADGLPSARLSAELPKLTARTKYTFAALNNADVQLKKFANTGLHALGIEIGGAQASYQQIAEQMNRISAQTRAIGLESFALGIPSKSVALQAISAGLRYLEGDVIMPAAKDPRSAYMHGLQDLYGPAISQ